MFISTVHLRENLGWRSIRAHDMSMDLGDEIVLLIYSAALMAWDSKCRRLCNSWDFCSKSCSLNIPHNFFLRYNTAPHKGPTIWNYQYLYRTSALAHSFIVVSSKNWNDLPLTIKSVNTLNRFTTENVSFPCTLSLALEFYILLRNYCCWF
jgi:hypothetical protein